MTDEVISEMIDKINGAVSPPTEDKVELTDAAANKIIELAKKEGKDGHSLRIKVIPGGCSGYSYDMHFEDKVSDSDKVFEKNGAKLIIDPDSLGYLKGTTIDFVDSLQGAGFKLINPNAKSACGCGNSVGF